MDNRIYLSSKGLMEKKNKKFCEENKIEMLILFGSCALEGIHSKSDIDIAVRFRKGIDISKLDLIYKLDDLFNGKNIDLVILTPDIDPLLLYEIFFKGRLLYEKRKGLFDEGRLKAWKLFIDTEKFRAKRKEYLKKFVKDVKEMKDVA
jgi:predicted nucleotidyltransferase